MEIFKFYTILYQFIIESCKFIIKILKTTIKTFKFPSILCKFITKTFKFTIKFSIFSQKSLQQLDWKPLIRIPVKHKVTFFVTDTRLYLLAQDPLRNSTIHYFDLMRCGRFVKNFATFPTKADANEVNVSKLKGELGAGIGGKISVNF